MCKDTDLTDKIFTAWENHDQAELERLLTELPEGYSICVVNPEYRHPTVAMVRNDEIESSMEGLFIRPDGSETRKRTLIAGFRGR